MIKRAITLVGSLILILLVGVSCRSKGCTDPDASNYEAKADIDDGSCQYLDDTYTLRAQFMSNYADIAFAMYDDAFRRVAFLREEVELFAKKPSNALLQRCRFAWKLARIPYAKSEVFRFYGGPIDDADRLDYRIGEWRINTSFLEQRKPGDALGIIDDVKEYPDLDVDLLLELNQDGADTNVTLGFHVIEYLLWGADTTEPLQLSAGKRSYQDYQADTSTQGIINGRRLKYLQLAVQQLETDLLTLSNAWSAEVGGNYRNEYLKLNSRKAVRYAMSGIATLSKTEWAENRIWRGLESFNSETEVSKYSDFTNEDLLNASSAIVSIYNGVYIRMDSTEVSGTSLHDIFVELNDTLANQVKGMNGTVTKLCAEVKYPYDYRLSLEFSTGVGPIRSAYEGLVKQGDMYVELGNQLGLNVMTKYSIE